MDIRLVVVDVDGTIAGRSNQVSERVIDAIGRVRSLGIPVAICTGRMYRSARRFHDTIKSSLPLIAYNGAWIQDPFTGTRHLHTSIPEDHAVELLDFLEGTEQKKPLTINFYHDDTLYVREITEENRIYAERSGIEAVPVGDLRKIAAKGTTKILAMARKKKTIDRLWSELQERFLDRDLYFTQSTATFFEVTHKNATKGNATKFLAEELLGLQPENVLAIGDNFNDVTMLRYAGLGVAMDNAPREVKKLADWVAPSVDLDGVAVTLEKFIL